MNKPTKITIITLIVLAIAALGGYLYWRQHHLKSDAVTTSKATSAQNNYKGDDRHSEDSQGGSGSQGGAVDNNGDQSASVNDSAAVVSSSGVISLTSPLAGSTITSGSTILRGTAKGLTEVQYRLIDDSAGVIGQGTLKVVSGTYSGTLQFIPQASTGRIDVFSFNSNYQEQNNVQIAVKFKR